MALQAFVKKLVEGYKRSLGKKEEKEEKETETIPPSILKIIETIKPEKEEKEEKEEKIEGLEIPEFALPSRVKMVRKEKELPLKLVYPLIPKNPKKGETVFAYAKIFWDEKTKGYVYNVVEPELTEKLKLTLNKIKDLLEQRLDVDLSKLKMVEASEFLRKQINDIIDYFGFKITPTEREILRYYVERDFLGLGKIEPLMKDDNIEDISCDGVNIPVFVYHRNPQIGSVRTNVIFADKEELDSFVMRLAQVSGKSISVAEPLVDATLPDGSRLQATLGTDIARKGSNFTIRRFTTEPLTPTHLLNYKTIDAKSLAYLWLAVDYGRSILISGGTASGKTTLLNVLSLFIRPEKRIVSIEDTSELQLPHPHWVPTVARTPISRPEKEEVDLFKLLKESIRQRPEYIIVGEVRGQEAFILFQQISSIPGNEKVLVLNDNNLKTIPIREIKKNKSYKVPTIDPITGEVKMLPLEAVVEHPPVKELYKVTTKTGREVITTGSHSLFTYHGKIEPIQVNELKKDDIVIIPAKLPCGYNDINYLNLIELFPHIRVYAPKLIKKASRKLGFDRASKIAGITTISNYYGVNNCALPAIKFKKLMKEANIKYKLSEIVVRFERAGSPLKAKLNLTPYLLRLLGYYISEGSLNKANASISLYNKNRAIVKDMEKCILKVTGKKPRVRKIGGYGKSIELTFNHKTIFEILKRFCGCKSEKKVPNFIFGLSKRKIGEFLSALYAGDGYLGKKFFCYYTTSKKLANDVSNLLLVFGIVSHIKKRKRKNRKNCDYEIRFYREDEKREFLKFVKPIGKKILFNKKEEEKKNIFRLNDVYLDRVKKIEKIKLERAKPVYDLSVPGTQNFIGGFGGIMLHNTGHPSLATIHADTIQKLFDKLTTPPISLPPSLIGSLDLIVFLCRVRYREKFVRRVTEILEMIRYDEKKGKPIVNEVFRWNPFTDKIEVVNKSALLKKISSSAGIFEEELIEELKRRTLVLEWMQKRNIKSYREVYAVLTEYYHNPNRVLAIAAREIG
jgi:flagellar protein FlaI